MSDTPSPHDYPANHQDNARLKRMGTNVRARLVGNPKVYQVPTGQAEIFAVGDFMSPEECTKMIGLIDDCAKPSQVFDLKYEDGYRTSFSGNVDPYDPFVKMLNRRVDDLLGVDPDWGERIQGQRYKPGQEFQPHHDWFHPGTSYWKSEMKRGGQRSFTTMVFLNDVKDGGTTDFTDLGLSFEPKPGVLLAWNNASPNGIPNLRTMHAGRPVIEGTKYIFTKWYRTKPVN